jgi:hypothetical protein
MLAAVGFLSRQIISTHSMQDYELKVKDNIDKHQTLQMMTFMIPFTHEKDEVVDFSRMSR